MMVNFNGTIMQLVTVDPMQPFKDNKLIQWNFGNFYICVGFSQVIIIFPLNFDL